MSRPATPTESPPSSSLNARVSLPRALGCASLIVAMLLFALPMLTHEKMQWGMDLSFASQMTKGMLDGLRDGYLYPRWVDAMSRSFGAPVFVFYPPLAYYASGLVALWTDDIAQAIQIVAILSALLSGLAFFVAARPITTELGASIGAAFYILLPYHVLDLYDRYAFAELVAFIWIPLLFRFVRDLSLRSSGGVALGLGASYAALVLTHLISAYLVLLALVPYGVVRVARARAWPRLLPMAGAGAAALLCCAVFLIPVLMEREHVYFEYFTESFFGNWRRNFAFRNPVEFGFTESEIRPSIEKCVASTGLFSLLALGLLFLRFPRSAARAGEAQRNGLLYAALCAWVIFLQLPVSTPVWASLPGLATAQFPWRFGLLQVLFASLQAACLFCPPERASAAGGDLAQRFSPGRILQTRSGAVLAALVLAATPAAYVSVDLTDNRHFVYDGRIALEPRVQSKVLQEYIPRTSSLRKEVNGLPFVADPRARWLGEGQVEIVSWTSHARRLVVEARAPGTLLVATFVYPGWQAVVDGRPVEIEPTTPAGLIGIPLPAGRHEAEVVFTATPPRRVGGWISLASLAASLTLALVLWLRRRRAATPA